MTIYRIDPKVNNKLVDPDAPKSIAICPAEEFSREWLATRHGYGLYEVYFNDASDKPAYMSGKIDLRDDHALMDAMFTKDRCRIDLRTVLPVAKNDGYIKSWTAAGMWPPGKEDNDMAVQITPELLTALRGEGGGGSKELLLPILLKLLDRDSKPAAGGITKEEMLAYGQQIAETTAAKIKADQQAEKIRELEAKLAAVEAGATTNAGGATGLAVVEKRALQLLTKKLLAQIDGGDDDEEESWIELIKKHAPGLVRQFLPALQGGAAPAAANPSQVIQMPEPAAEEPDPEGETELDMIAELLALYLRGKPAAVAATWLVEIAEQRTLYERLIAQGSEALVATLSNPMTAQVLEDAPTVIAQRPQFEAWLKEFLTFYDEDAPDAPTEPAPADPVPTPATTAKKGRKK